MEIQSKTVTSGVGPRQRKVILEIGKEYIVSPINERNMENRGRRCLLLEFVPYSPDKTGDEVARVEFLDNHRRARVELEDLIPI